MASRKEWKGNASQLLAALEEVVGEKVAKSKNWPASAEMLGRSLRRPATFLRKVGIEIGFKREGSARKIIITRNPLADWVGEQPSQPKQGQSAGDDRGGDSGRASWAGEPPQIIPRRMLTHVVTVPRAICHHICHGQNP